MNRRSGKDSRKKILDAAFVVFSEHGYEKTSMRMIAAGAGLSVGGLYLYFENKETLYSTLMERVLEDLSRDTEERVKEISDPVSAFNAFIDIRLAYAARNKELIITNSREPKLALGAEIRKRFFERQRRLVELIVSKGIESGDFAECDPAEAAKVITSVLRGYVFSLVIDQDNLFSPEECRRVMLNGLLARQGGSGRTVTGV